MYQIPAVSDRWPPVISSAVHISLPAVELDNTIQFSTLSRMSGLLWYSSKWVCCFGRSLQYTSGIEVLACSLDTDLNYVATSSNWTLSWTDNFFLYSQKQILHNSSSALSWTWGPLLNFLVKCIQIFKILSGVSCSFGLFMLSSYIWLILPAWGLASIHINFVHIYSLE